MEILASREGGGGSVAPLLFDGATNYFKELPVSSDINKMKKVHSFLEELRNNKV